MAEHILFKIAAYQRQSQNHSGPVVHKTTETSHNNEISTTQWKQAATQQN